MCLLIVLRGFHDDFPVLVASNRDEDRSRKAAPPGLFVGDRLRLLSPRDRRDGGTWLGVNERGMFCGLTNAAGEAAVAGRPSRGHLPHLALDQDDPETALAAVRERVLEEEHNPFHLVAADRGSIRILRHTGSGSEEVPWQDPVCVLSNEHRPGTLSLAGLERALGPVQDADHRLDLLRPLLIDEGGMGRHRVLKKGGPFGTVSSSLIAVPDQDLRTLMWRFAPGPPDETAYRNYGNLGRRLVEG